MIEKITKLTYSFLARTAAGTLGELIHQALMTGDRDAWLVFLDGLEEKDPEFRAHLQELKNHTLPRLARLAKKFPDSGMKSSADALKLPENNICNFIEIKRIAHSTQCIYADYSIYINGEYYRVNFSKSVKLIGTLKIREITLVSGEIHLYDQKVNRILTRHDSDYHAYENILKNLVNTARQDYEKLIALFAMD